MIEEKYREILNLSHHQSTKHLPMSMRERGAQFAPFSALAGHGEGAAETARTTQNRRELWEDEILVLDGKLREIEERQGERPRISVTYFAPDNRKEGGSYPTVTGQFKRIDHHRRVVVLVDGREIPVEDIVEIE